MPASQVLTLVMGRLRPPAAKLALPRLPWHLFAPIRPANVYEKRESEMHAAAHTTPERPDPARGRRAPRGRCLNCDALRTLEDMRSCLGCGEWFCYLCWRYEHGPTCDDELVLEPRWPASD